MCCPLRFLWKGCPEAVMILRRAVQRGAHNSPVRAIQVGPLQLKLLGAITEAKMTDEVCSHGLHLDEFPATTVVITKWPITHKYGVMALFHAPQRYAIKVALSYGDLISVFFSFFFLGCNMFCPRGYSCKKTIKTEILEKRWGEYTPKWGVKNTLDLIVCPKSILLSLCLLLWWFLITVFFTLNLGMFPFPVWKAFKKCIQIAEILWKSIIQKTQCIKWPHNAKNILNDYHSECTVYKMSAQWGKYYEWLSFKIYSG